MYTTSGRVCTNYSDRLQVVAVQQDSMATTASPRGAQKLPICSNQPLSPFEAQGEWGLGRISHYNNYPLFGYGWPFYIYHGSAVCKANGYYAYVIDSGISNHPDFEGRAKILYRSDPSWPIHDVCGHGTHVAGLIASKTHGVMKKAEVISVKVLEGKNAYCGGPWSGVMSGMDWSFAHASAAGRLAQSVVNMSLGRS